MAREIKCASCKRSEETEYTELNGIYYCHYYGGYTDGIMFDPKNCPVNKGEENEDWEKVVNTVVLYDPDEIDGVSILKTVLTKKEIEDVSHKVCNDPRIETDDNFNCMEETLRILKEKDPSIEIDTDVINISLC